MIRSPTKPVVAPDNPMLLAAKEDARGVIEENACRRAKELLSEGKQNNNIRKEEPKHFMVEKEEIFWKSTVEEHGITSTNDNIGNSIDAEYDLDPTKDGMKLSAIEKTIMMIRSPTKPVVAPDNAMLLAAKEDVRRVIKKRVDLRAEQILSEGKQNNNIRKKSVCDRLNTKDLVLKFIGKFFMKLFLLIIFVYAYKFYNPLFNFFISLT